jgi:hypothetical protein
MSLRLNWSQSFDWSDIAWSHFISVDYKCLNLFEENSHESFFITSASTGILRHSWYLKGSFFESFNCHLALRWNDSASLPNFIGLNSPESLIETPDLSQPMHSCHLNYITWVILLFKSILNFFLSDSIEITLYLVAIVQSNHSLRVKLWVRGDTAKESNSRIKSQLRL